MARPVKAWYKAMDVLYVNHKLSETPSLKSKYGEEYNNFVCFCYKVMELYGWQKITEIQDEFDKKSFYGIQNKRMYETNVKKWKNISAKVFERDKYTCQYCGQLGGTLEVDHITPFSKGGSDDLTNLVTSCRRCNRQKKDKSVDEFVKWRKQHEQLLFPR